MPIPFNIPCGPMLISSMTTAPMATMVDPTARSMPPEMITNVIPRAMMPTEALLRSTLMMLRSHARNHSPKVDS